MHDTPQILLVEDEEGDAELALRALAACDPPATVHLARDGEQAAEFLFGPGGPGGRPGWPGLRVILLDTKLPKIDGLELLSRLRRDPATRHVPEVVLTSSTLPADVTATHGAGANSYVVEQVDYDRHAENLRQIGRYWLGLNALP